MNATTLATTISTAVADKSEGGAGGFGAVLGMGCVVHAHAGGPLHVLGSAHTHTQKHIRINGYMN